MNEETRERINRCARILKLTQKGQLVIVENYARLTYKVNQGRHPRVYRTLEALEAFTESLLRNRPTAVITQRRSRIRPSHTSNYLSI